MKTIVWNRGGRGSPAGGRAPGNVEALDGALRVVVGEDREQVGDLDAVLEFAVDVEPPIVNGAPFSVSFRPSNAASLSGWSSATVRAAQSPMTSCTGAIRQANVSGTIIAARTYCRGGP